jgi:hypothetical protein
MSTSCTVSIQWDRDYPRERILSIATYFASGGFDGSCLRVSTINAISYDHTHDNNPGVLELQLPTLIPHRDIPPHPLSLILLAPMVNAIHGPQRHEVQAVGSVDIDLDMGWSLYGIPLNIAWWTPLIPAVPFPASRANSYVPLG